MSDNAAPVNLDYQQVNYLLELLRKRTPEEIVIGALLFAPAFTPEMRQALILLHLERSAGGVHNAAVRRSATPNLQTDCQPKGAGRRSHPLITASP
jgi:hypothetical protein